jgi:hypothetical protein
VNRESRACLPAGQPGIATRTRSESGGACSYRHELTGFDPCERAPPAFDEELSTRYRQIWKQIISHAGGTYVAEETVGKPVNAAEVANLMYRLHDQGIVNLDKPVRSVLEQLESIRPGSSLQSYVIGWSSYGLVVKQ